MTTVQLVVPAGDASQEVKIIVVDDAGVRTIVRKTVPPGTRINETIRTHGYTIVQIYLQGRIVQEIRP